jgi:hypothetical protein
MDRIRTAQIDHLFNPADQMFVGGQNLAARISVNRMTG